MERINEHAPISGRSVHALAWSPSVRPDAERRVVLLLDHRSVAHVPLDRAVQLADGLRARLHVVLSIPRGTAPIHPALVAARVSSRLEARPPRQGFDLEVVHGDLRAHGLEIAAELAASLIVVDSAFGTLAACRAVDLLEVPVFVARDAREQGDVIAATDMRHLGFPVLSLGKDVGRALDRSVIFFHNAAPRGVLRPDPAVGAATYVARLQLEDDAVAAKRARLRRVAARDGASATIVSRAPSTVNELLRVARRRDADVLVLGRRPQSWFRRLVDRDVTARIAAGARRSVLIAPVQPRA